MLIPYIILTLIIIIGRRYFNDQKISKDKQSRILPILICFLLLQALRLHCQQYFPDIPEYKDVFQQIPDLYTVLINGGILKYFGTETSLEIEIGFNVFTSFIKYFTSDYEIYLFIVSVIEFYILYYFCKQAKVEFLTTLPAYVGLTYTAFQIGILRQALAFCILLLAILSVKRKWEYILLMLIGYTFHRSMLFCILLLWVDKFIRPKYIVYVFIVSLLIYLLQIEIINEIWGRFLSEDSNRVNYYLSVNRANNYLGIGFWERVVEFVVITIFYIKIRKKYSANGSSLSGSQNQNKTYKFSGQDYIWRMNVFYNISVSLVLMQMIFFSSPTITSRLRYYIVLFPMLFMGEYIRKEIPNKKKWYYLIPLFLYLAIYMTTQSGYLRGVIDNV